MLLQALLCFILLLSSQTAATSDPFLSNGIRIPAKELGHHHRRCSASRYLTQSRRPSTAFAFCHHPHDGHVGKELSRSSIWSRMTNATHNFIDQVEHAVEAEARAIGRYIKKERLVLEHFEDSVEVWWKHSRPMFGVAGKGIVGATMLGTGAHFSRCVILMHGVRVTGWPLLRKALKEIATTYQRTREAVKKEVGHVPRPRELLQAVTYELKGVQRILKESQDELEDGNLTRHEAKQIIKQAEVDIKRLSYEAWVLNQACDSMAALSAAIDFHRLKEVGKGLYTGALACVASANSVTVQKLSLAFDLGSILSNNIHCIANSVSEHIHSKTLAQVIPPETRRLIGFTITAAGTLKGLLIVKTLMPKMSLRISSSALGAAWMTEALAEVLDPVLKKHGWSPIADHYPFVPIHAGLTVLGYVTQKRYPGRFPIYIEKALIPVSIAEARLKSLSTIFKK